MRDIVVVVSVIGELAGDVGSGTASSCSLGISALHHEAVHDPVEGKAVIESAVCKIYEVCNRDGSLICIELYGDRAVTLYLYLYVVKTGEAALGSRGLEVFGGLILDAAEEHN